MGGSSLIIGLLVLSWLIFGSDAKPPEVPPSEATLSEEIEAASALQTSANEALFPDASDNVAFEKPPEFAVPGNSEAEAPDHAESTIQSPTEVCQNETNFFSRNSCMWHECEKPEFSDLKECENRKQKGPTIGPPT